MSDTPEPKGPLATGSFELSVALSQQRTMKVSGYLYHDEPPALLNARIDALQDVMDRQLIRADLVNKRAQIDQHLGNLENIKQHYQGLVDKQKSGAKIVTQEKTAMGNYDRTVQQVVDVVASLRAAIAEGEKKLAVN